MALAPDAEWEVSCSREQSRALANEPRLQQVVTRARIVNSIRFIQVAVADQHAKVKPLLYEVTQTAIRVADAAEHLIAAVLREQRWQYRQLPHGRN